MCARACACVCQQLFRNPPPATPSPGRISCQPRAQPHSMVRFPISLSSEDCWPGSGWSKARSPCKNSQAGGPQTNMGLEVGRGGGQDQGDLSLCVTIPAAASRGPPFLFHSTFLTSCAFSLYRFWERRGGQVEPEGLGKPLNKHPP